jgi:hypothetical protein
VPTAPTRGRWFVLGWTAVFLAVASVITVRDTRGFARSRALDSLTDSLRVLQDMDITLRAEVETLLSAGEVARRGAALGLRAPSDSEIHTLRVPAR